MTPADLERGVDWIETRWGQATAWSRWEELYEDFADYSAGALMEALSLLYRGGQKYPPGSAEVMKTISETQRKRIERGEDDQVRVECESHTWAVPTAAYVDTVPSCVRCGVDALPGTRIMVGGEVVVV